MWSEEPWILVRTEPDVNNESIRYPFWAPVTGFLKLRAWPSTKVGKLVADAVCLFYKGFTF